MDEINSSPLPKNTMDFSSAIRRVIDGEKITKLEWNNKNIYGVLRDGILMLHKDDGKFYQWIINDGDLLGIDWVVVPMN